MRLGQLVHCFLVSLALLFGYISRDNCAPNLYEAVLQNLWLLRTIKLLNNGGCSTEDQIIRARYRYHPTLHVYVRDAEKRLSGDGNVKRSSRRRLKAFGTVFDLPKSLGPGFVKCPGEHITGATCLKIIFDLFKGTLFPMTFDVCSETTEFITVANELCGIITDIPECCNVEDCIVALESMLLTLNNSEFSSEMGIDSAGTLVSEINLLSKPTSDKMHQLDNQHREKEFVHHTEDLYSIYSSSDKHPDSTINNEHFKTTSATIKDFAHVGTNSPSPSHFETFPFPQGEFEDDIYLLTRRQSLRQTGSYPNSPTTSSQGTATTTNHLYSCFNRFKKSSGSLPQKPMDTNSLEQRRGLLAAKNRISYPEFKVLANKKRIVGSSRRKNFA